jgi:hypothetical protein
MGKPIGDGVGTGSAAADRAALVFCAGKLISNPGNDR